LPRLHTYGVFTPKRSAYPGACPQEIAALSLLSQHKATRNLRWEEWGWCWKPARIL